ncbi:MAG: hypothetical protein COW65_13165 [Cytophagales bacterium CG18_big_fil_WC_8_21_14_2_50_42_9]|nr:MAG: hypothetical protein COW65_13165 [Cytophagales bacterium CG18_big_fil_WC_8_21_14_2_50_42_9]
MNTNFDEQTTRTVNDLIETCRGGMKGYETAAGKVENPELKSEFSRLSQQRAVFINELESTARQYGLTAQNEDTLEEVAMDAASAVHRGWMNLKSALTGNTSEAILSECENGDAAALKTYEQALAVQTLPPDLIDVIEKQHQQILEAKNHITSLKQTI